MAARKQPTGWVQYVAPARPSFLRRKVARGSPQYSSGATRSGDNVWFAWNSAPHDGFPQPYIEMVKINTSGGFSKVQQVQIWNAAFAFALPSLATSACNGEIGLSLAYGGGV